MAYTLNQLGGVLLKQLSDILNGGDDRVPTSPNSFLTYCAPGLPFDAKEFDFAADGFGAAADAADYRRRLQQAFNFAQLVDFIPTLDAPYGKREQEYLSRPSQQRLSTLYGEILRFSKVVNQELTPEQTAKIEKFRKLLTVTKEQKNLVTDEVTQVTVDSPMIEAYRAKMAAYIEARLSYNAKRIAAEAATGATGVAAVADWASNAELYWLRVKAARDAWVATGYRNEVDEINAFLDQVTRRSMKLWKQSLVENFEKSQLSSTTPGSTFHFTTLIPGNFATSAGWTEYAMSHEHAAGNTHTESTTWSAGGSVSFGLFSFGANASGSSSSIQSDFKTESFSLSMELAPVLISRPGFYPEFFKNRGWTLKKGDGWFYKEFPSDGGRPPKGNFIGYPTIAVFARNIVIESKEFASAFEHEQSQVSAGGSVGWGPFSLSGSYGHGESTTAWQATRDGAKLRVPGMQLIAFVNELTGAAPNPMEGLDVSTFE